MSQLLYAKTHEWVRVEANPAGGKIATVGLTAFALEMSGKRAARHGCAILCDGHSIGEVTSCSYSPTLEKAIAMGYVAPAFTRPGQELFIDIRGRQEPARVVELPFYKCNKKGTKK